MNQNENALAKAVHNLFMSEPANMGIAKGKPPICEPTNGMPHQYEWINDLFRLKLVESLGDSSFYESITSAFYDIHSYRFINDQKFNEALITRLKAIGIPLNEIKIALDTVQKVMSEIKTKYGMKADEEFDERSAGWNEQLDEIKKASQIFNRKPEREEAMSGGGPWPKEKELANANIKESIESTPDTTPEVDIGHSNSIDRILTDLKYKKDLFTNRGDQNSAQKYEKMIVAIESALKESNDPAAALRKYEELLRNEA